MRERLSSGLTHVYKLTFLFVVSYGLYWLTSDFGNVSLSPVLFLALWCTIWYGVTSRWKSVYLEGNALYVSNYLKKIRIPLTEVKGVEVSLGTRPCTVVVTLKSPSEFGKRIVFVPKGAGFSASEVADKLKRLAARN
jgi:hypothetical protein